MEIMIFSNRRKCITNSRYYKRCAFHKCLFFFIIVFLTVGYAYLNTSLDVNGVNKIENNRWDVHFENIEIVDGSVYATNEATITDDTVIDFLVDLRLPGDVYSFTVNVVNDGTIDAMLSEVLNTGLTVSQEAYVEYTVTYADGEEILSKDALPGGQQDQLLVSVKYKDDIEADDLPSENQIISLTLKADYVQDDGTSTDRRPPAPARYLYDEIVVQNQEDGLMVLDNQKSTYVDSNTGIDFKGAPSDANGKGVYVKSGTESDTYPIYYYRGEVTNNNVIFGGFCWKIVRTTETGGIKLIYNGRINEQFDTTPIEGSEYINIVNDVSHAYEYDNSTKTWTSTSNNADETETIITFSVANTGYYALNYVVSSEENYDKAYFYLDNLLLGEYSGEAVGSISLGELTSTNVVTVKYIKDGGGAGGNDTISFNVGLKSGEILSSCSNSGTASQIAAAAFNVNYENNAHIGYMYGTAGSDSYDEVHLSTKESSPSTIKTVIDTWYENSMTNYTSYLEDTVWCNDRSFASSNTGTGTGMSATYYGAYERNWNNNSVPSLECIKQNDRFTVNETMNGRVNGNGALTYPIALLTADEVTLAGNGNRGYSSTSYLTTGDWWWLLSPSYFSDGAAYSFQVDSPGNLGFSLVDYSVGGVRPALSLRQKTIISEEGDGSEFNPYVVK